jgi:hypothetical protein
MSHAEHLTLSGNQCEVHGYHYPKPARTVKHHKHPQEYGGKTTPENLVLVCDTGHYNIHTWIDVNLKGKGETPKLTKKELEIARIGLAAAQQAFFVHRGDHE